MTSVPQGQSTGSEPAGAAVDRRWFEEALRSQGFVVEPPAAEADAPGQAPLEAAEDAPGPAPTTERPPVPSALLARIASRSAPAPVAEDGAAATLGAVPSPGPTVSTPWGEAVVATQAPWSPEHGVEPDAQPGADAPSALGPEVASEPDAQPEAVLPPMPVGQPEASQGASVLVGPEAVVVAADPVADGPPEPAPMAAPSGPAEAAAPPGDDAARALESPYAAAVVTPVAAPSAPPATSVGPEASEGELWALVGGAEPASAQAAGSGPLRTALTILTALVILVVVVGALVLASQLA